MKGLEQLSKMVGKPYMYSKEVYTITGFIPEESKVRVKTDGKDIVLLYDDMPHCLSLFLEVEEEQVSVAKTAKTAIMANSGASDIQSLKNILLDNIRKVQESKEYVPQAAQISKSVTAFTNLAKAEMEYFKMLNT